MFLVTGILTLLVCSSSALGQSEEGERQDDHLVAGSVDYRIVGGNSMTRFVTSELSLYRDVVKNAPYSAEAVTETTQTLADGNQIYREMTAVLYRDSEGRTRREQTLTGYIPWASSPPGQAFQVIVINDPVAGVSYTLNPATRTAIAHEMSNFKSLPMQDVRHFMSDGNQIYREMTAVLYRDSEGRTRREQTLTGYIPWASSPPGQAFQVIVINDPVAGVSYTLNPATRTAIAHEMSNFMSLPMQDVRQGSPGVYLFSQYRRHDIVWDDACSIPESGTR